jgi:NADPH-dependent 2,4-dienoyl-CoA reductase/sulfur reductase-like enzyme
VADRFVVVGAGLAGLAVAAELAADAEVELVERLPEVGGTWGFEHPDVVALRRRCVDLGVRLTLGVAALRWVGRRLLLVGPGERAWRDADRLVFAGGTRPSTAAELPVFGARTAGVFAGTVAHHLLEGRVPLGRRPIVCGEGYWADLVLAELPADVRATRVGGAGSAASNGPDVWPGYRPIEIRGRDRVDQLVIAREGDERALACDCVVLAGDQRPLRNVDGAIVDGPDVTFAQLCADSVTPAAVIDHATRSTASLTRRKR